MANIVIKKTVNLDFLGKEYAESNLTFKSLSLKEYEGLLDKLKTAQEDGKESLKLIASILEEQFLSGSFLGEAVSKDDLKEFDLETLTKCFELFTGRTPDPKAD